MTTPTALGAAHDCGAEDAPELLAWRLIDVGGFWVWHYLCPECSRFWWLIEGTFYNPSEWDSVAEIYARSQS